MTKEIYKDGQGINCIVKRNIHLNPMIILDHLCYNIVNDWLNSEYTLDYELVLKLKNILSELKGQQICILSDSSILTL